MYGFDHLEWFPANWKAHTIKSCCFPVSLNRLSAYGLKDSSCLCRLAFLGFAAQYQATGKGPLENLKDHLANPSYVRLFPTIAINPKAVAKTCLHCIICYAPKISEHITHRTSQILHHSRGQSCKSLPFSRVNEIARKSCSASLSLSLLL